jgi:hypothetical protein
LAPFSLTTRRVRFADISHIARWRRLCFPTDDHAMARLVNRFFYASVRPPARSGRTGGLPPPAHPAAGLRMTLPFPPEDPLCGPHPPKGEKVLFLGRMAVRGERGLLKIPADALLRLRSNPVYGYLERRTLARVDRHGPRPR